MNFRALGLAVVLASAISAPALPHHPSANVDFTKSITISGTVRTFEWINPHSSIQLVTQGVNRKQVEWSIEMGSPAQQAQQGWTSDSVKAGDNVSVTFHPLKSGLQGGLLMSAVLANGQHLANSSPTPPVAITAPPVVFESQIRTGVLSPRGLSTPSILMTGLVLLVGAFRLRHWLTWRVVRA